MHACPLTPLSPPHPSRQSQPRTTSSRSSTCAATCSHGERERGGERKGERRDGPFPLALSVPSHARAPPLKRPPSPPPKKKPAPSLSSDSPFVIDNNAGGGFVGDKDVIALQVSKYESETSSGERGEEKGQSRRGRARGVRASARGRPAAPLSFCSHARPPSHPLTLSLFFLAGAGCVAGSGRATGVELSHCTQRRLCELVLVGPAAHGLLAQR